MWLFGLLAGLTISMLLAAWAIRRALAAPRVRASSNPGACGLDFSSVVFPTANGRCLRGWLIAPATTGTATAPAPAVILLHGWGGNAETLLPLAAPLWHAGFGLLLFDARNHGLSDSDDFVSLPRFAEDLEHAIDWLRRQPGIDPRRIAAVGHSVGAGACLLAAARSASLAAIVSIAAFAHPDAMMRRWLAWRRIPYWPLGWAILAYVQHVIGTRFDHIAPVNTMPRVRCPVLLVHGIADTTVPVTEAHRIHARRSHDQVELLLLPGSHDEFPELQDGIAAVRGFLIRHLSPQGATR